MARVPTRRRQPSGSDASVSCSSVGEPERKRARNVEFNSGHLKPFEQGFRREMVVRGTVAGQDGGRAMSDIYYYAPCGTKLRSRPEVSAYLVRNRELPLTADNFNFTRMSIHQPPHEIVRNAEPRHSGKFKAARATRASAQATLTSAVPASPTPVRATAPAAVPASTTASLAEHASSGTSSGRRRARRPFCGCCEPRHDWDLESHRHASRHHYIHRATKKWPTRGAPRGYRRAPRPTTVLSGRHLNSEKKDKVPASQPPVAQNATCGKVHGDESSHKKVLSPALSKQQGCDPDKRCSLVDKPAQQVESRRKSVSPFKQRLFRVPKPTTASKDEHTVEPFMKHAVVVVKDILKTESGKTSNDTEAGENGTSDTSGVLSMPKFYTDSWQNATERKLYRILKGWKNTLEQAAVSPTEDDLLGDPVIIKEGTEPLGASPALDLSEQSPVEGSSPLSSPSKQAALSRQPCTPTCPRAMGETPELQCKRCLCFFHPICIGRTGSHVATTRRRFICKACTKLPYKSAEKSTTRKQPTSSAIDNPVASSSRKQDLEETAQETSVFQPGPHSLSSTLIPATGVTPVSTCSSFSYSVASSSSAAPLMLIRPSYSLASSALPIVLSSASTISVPVVHLMANGAVPKQLPFTSSPTAPAAVRAAPGTLTTGALKPSRTSLSGTGRHSLPQLLPAPPSPVALAAAIAKAQKIPSLRIQSAGGQDVTVCPSAYYTIHLAQKPGSINSATLKSIVSQLVENCSGELQRRATCGQSIILQAQPAVLPPSAQPAKLVQQAAHSLLQPAAVGHTAASAAQPTISHAGTERAQTIPFLGMPLTVAEKQKVGTQLCPPASMAQAVSGSGDCALLTTAPQHKTDCTSTELFGNLAVPETSPQIVLEVEPDKERPGGKQQIPANANPAVLRSFDRVLVASVMSNIPVVTSSGMKVPSESQQMSCAAVCRSLMAAQELESDAVPFSVEGQETALLNKTQYANMQLLVASSTAEMGTQIVPKEEPDMELVPFIDTVNTHTTCEQGTAVNGAQSPLYVCSSSCEPHSRVESTPQAFTAKETSHAFRSVSPLLGCPFVISSSYSLAGEDVSESHSSFPAECDGKQGASGANTDQAYVVVSKDRSSADESDTSVVRMAYEIERIWPASSHGGSEVPSPEDVSAMHPFIPHISGNTAVSMRPAGVEQTEPRDKVPASHTADSDSGAVQCLREGSQIKIKSKRVHHLTMLPEPPYVSLWLSNHGRLTCVRDWPDSTSANRVEFSDHVQESMEPVNCVLGCGRIMQDFADLLTVMTEIFNWLPTPTLCKAAQVCRAWRKLSAMSMSWKRVNFTQFRVNDWDACVKMLRYMRTEELVLEKDSLEPILDRITMLDLVKHVTVEVNPLQLACVARAFPHLHSISALISRRGTAEHQHPASLGGLSELLCVAGLERLELRGAHGLAILPLTMTPISLAQRCQQLRALCLVTIKNMSPDLLFLISLLHGLEELQLGECLKWSKTAFLNISKLRQLQRLTLEHGEDNYAFHSMLLRLNNLEKLELKQWTLHKSLADTLPHMTQLRHLMLCPANNDLASKTNRNVLRSCLAAGPNLEQITWMVSCKSPTAPQALFDHRLAFEPGNLCECSPIFAASNAPPAFGTGGDSLRNVGLKARETVNIHAQGCVLAKKFRHVWKPSQHVVWYLTLRQVCQGLKHCLGPRTALCFCARVEQ